MTRRAERKTNALPRQRQDQGDLQPLDGQEELKCSSAFRVAALLSAAITSSSSSSHTLGIYLHLPHCRKKILFSLSLRCVCVCVNVSMRTCVESVTRNRERHQEPHKVVFSVRQLSQQQGNKFTKEVNHE